ncbi:hypothetical protein D3C72_245140 [compost metagenome]
MKLQDIVEEIIERTSGAIHMPSIIRKVDTLQREIYRRYCRDWTWIMLDLEAEQPVYPLPCPPGNIRSVVVNGREYDNDPNQRCGEFYYIVERTINLHPTPDENVVEGLKIIYKRTPTELQISLLDTVPDLDEDYHMLLVHGVCKDVVKDPTERSWNQSEYDRLLREFIVASREPGELIMRVE